MNGETDDDEMFRSYNNLTHSMLFMEQFVSSVIDYSSRYNNSLSISYAPENLVGKPSRYPFSGDYADTYTMVSFSLFF